jgi:anti-sigma regulatory factor (Ser/Thr protein kinase)
LTDVVSDDAISFDVANELSAVPHAAERIEAFCRDRNIPEPIAYKFNLALDETLTNAISYAFADGGRHQIDVRVENRDGYLTATVSDDGAPFDPLSQPPADVHAAVEDRKIGGLGIHLLRTLMDTVEYRRRDGRNHVTFRIRVVP